jgi:hypothetical protein
MEIGIPSAAWSPESAKTSAALVNVGSDSGPAANTGSDTDKMTRANIAVFNQSGVMLLPILIDLLISATPPKRGSDDEPDKVWCHKFTQFEMIS